jgi:hypothetical protein
VYAALFEDFMNLPRIKIAEPQPISPRARELGIQGWGHARCSAAEIAALRKTIPRWAAAGTPGHFFKYSDEQTILAVQALDNTIERHGVDIKSLADCAVIAAPQFLGRVQGAYAFGRFLRTGAQSISPHLIPQHSLHSVSGAISVLLGCHGPNLGVGGGPHSLDDALLTAMTLLESGAAAHCLLVCTAWDPEPLPDREGQCTNEPICHAFAVSLQPGQAAADCGSIRLQLHESLPQIAAESSSTTVARIVDEMTAAGNSMLPRNLQWRMNWGAKAELRLNPSATHAVRAA